ncbi:prephenate dehydratase [Spirulina sp. CS-785/01]|uniref:prephenate dehydratase n=1 Tax=Spirulina sp. CS-785/01 TaxID=3021716 RepID=UPI0023302ED6|nr:prephenate dehydratase [Spirulina sp. CS-785/01]MDB9315851.1 prephenate dehydratase [Spirulina sp. CS-785/01]
MSLSIAHLGPTGTYTETAALAYANWLQVTQGEDYFLCPYPTIAQTLEAVAYEQAHLAVVPVENSIQGSVAMTLDMLWQLDQLQIQQALVLPIAHVLLSRAAHFDQIKTVFSHPQALAQCQRWLNQQLPTVQQVASNSTTEALRYLDQDNTTAAIASERAAQLYQLPILAQNINDYPENCTRFWVLGLQPTQAGHYISLAFSVSQNIPGALVKPLQIFAERSINMSRIESRPTKRSLGEYLFYIELEGSQTDKKVHNALTKLPKYAEVLKIFGNYHLFPIQSGKVIDKIN